MSDEIVKLVVYVPVDDADKIRALLGELNCGHIGNYDYCSFSIKGAGRFRPLDGSRPAIGKKGEIEVVEEERIETVLKKSNLSDVLNAVRKAHPYEEAAIDVYPLVGIE